jgi:hypothetical protein
VIDWDQVVNGPVMEVFGEKHRYKPVAGTPFDVPGTFHEAYSSVTVVNDMAVTTESPALGVNLSSFPAPPRQKDEVTIEATSLHGGGTFTVKEVRPNGIGGVLLLLNKVREF